MASVVCFFLFLPVLTLGKVPITHTNLKIVPAAELRKINGVTVYESTAKLVFRIPVEDLHIPKVGDGTGSRLLQSIHNLSTLVQDDIFQELHGYSPLAGFKISKREKRQVLAAAGFAFAGGMMAQSIFHKLSKELFGDEDEIRDYLHKMRLNVDHTQQELVVIETEVKGYSEEMSTLVSSAFQISNEQDRALLHLSLLQLQRSWIIESKYACVSKLIPTRFVSQHELRDQLGKLSNRLRKQNMTLAIPLHKYSEMYKLPLADCTFTDEAVIVSINVPLMRVDEDWVIYEMIHNKFAYNGQTCSIYPHEQNYLAKSQTRAVLITSHMIAMCPIQEHAICFIPAFSRDNSGSVGCALALLQGKQVGEVANACSFACTPTTELIVQQVDEYNVVLTNAKTLDTYCPGKTEHREFELTGAVQVHIRCNCRIVVNTDFVLTPPLFCPVNAVSENDVIQISPNIWSKLGNALGSHSQFFKDHSDQTFDPDWNQNIPSLNLTVFKPLSLPDIPLMGSFSIRDFVISVLIISNTILWVVVSLICCAYVRA